MMYSYIDNIVYLMAILSINCPAVQADTQVD